jgi:EAL domain-containing protein (putative c-di-GMP-specific phosphodiesterase class I)/CHASE2 domain-containing sensor protein
MASVATTGGRKGRLKAVYRRYRLLVWATLVSVMIGLIGLAQPLEDALRTTRDVIRKHPASADLVVVAIDDRSLRKLASWPWPRRHHGALADAAAAAGARRIFFDVDFSSPSSPAEDASLEAALARFPGEVVLPVTIIPDEHTGKLVEHVPLPRFAAHSEPATINLRFDWRGAVWNLPHGLAVGGTVIPSFAAHLAGHEQGRADDVVPIDYAIDWRTVPVISAVDLLEGRVRSKSLAGKTVVIGATSPQLGDTFFYPQGGVISGVYLHVLGAHTLKNYRASLGWLPALLVAVAIGAACYRRKSARTRFALLGMSATAMLIVPIGLEANGVFVQVLPGLCFSAMMAGRLGWLRHKARSTSGAKIHPASGLPNFTALREVQAAEQRPLIVARVTNYSEIVSSLPGEQEKALTRQIAGRLTLGSAGQVLYQGDGGVFVWFADDEMTVTLSDHLNALHTLFRSPVVLAETQVDLKVVFGVETGSGRSTNNRLGSALVAAEEAAAEGLRWKQYDAARLKEAPWRLSLLSQLDAAIDAGELWIAYQPKLDLRTRRTIGAEALVRWTHPEKGPISPAEFVVAAEQSGRIHKLTAYVLERSIKAAAALNQRGIDFSVAVNLSARLIDDALLPERVAVLLARHHLEPGKLTLEITETAALGTTAAHLANLDRLRELGVHISVDDYGTGLSTLDYLKKIPASEIKIDRSFVQAMHRSEGDRVIVNSTIQLAHSLGRQVVAEGVEDRETLYELSLMGCDIAQGFYIGRPVALRSLARTLFQEREQGNVAVA